MYSNIKNRRLFELFGDDSNTLSQSLFGLRESRYKVKQYIKNMREPKGIVSYRTERKVHVEYPSANNINKFGINKRKDVVVNMIDEVERLEVKREYAENKNASIIEIYHPDKISGSEEFESNDHYAKMYTSAPEIHAELNMNNEPIIHAYKACKKETETETNEDSGIIMEQTASNQEETKTKSNSLTVNITFNKNKALQNLNISAVERLPIKYLLSSAECNIENDLNEIEPCFGENKNDESGINFDLSKCKHSTPHKESKNAVMVSKDSIVRLLNQILVIDEKVKRMQINSEVATEVGKALHLIQLLSQDLETNCNANKKLESSIEKNGKLSSETKKIWKLDTNQNSHKNLQIQSMEDERNVDLEEVSKEIAISPQRIRPPKEKESSSLEDTKLFQRYF